MIRIIDFQLITYAMTLVFSVLAIVSYLLAGEAYLPLWAVSFISLIATVGIDLIDRIAFVDDCDFECEECEKAPFHLNNNAD